MPCYYPLKASRVGTDVLSGKAIIKVFSNLEQLPDSMETFPIPCGRCIGCRLDYAHEWANRCLLELKYHEQSSFLTLTYDDLHVPRVVKDGQMYYTLDKRDLQLFFKRLRKAIAPTKIRYLACGEYGDEHFRPHFHVILFGYQFPDLEPLPSMSKTYRPMWRSNMLYDLWSMAPRSSVSQAKISPAGVATVQEVNYATCSYVARYVLKKLNAGDDGFYSCRGIVPPYLAMSRRPGIGRRFLDDHPDLFDTDFIHVSAGIDGGKKFRPPKYFERIRSELDPIAHDEHSALASALAEEAIVNEELMTGMDHIQYLNRLAEIKSAEIKSLKRSVGDGTQANQPQARSQGVPPYRNQIKAH